MNMNIVLQYSIEYKSIVSLSMHILLSKLSYFLCENVYSVYMYFI